VSTRTCGNTSCKECVGATHGTERTSASERPPSRGLVYCSLLFLSLYLASLLPPSYRLMLDTSFKPRGKTNTTMPSNHNRFRRHRLLSYSFSFFCLALSNNAYCTMPPPCGSRMLPFHILLDCPLCTYTSSIHSTSTRSSVYVFKIACQLVEEGIENHHRIHRFRIKMPLFPLSLV
jgi:hypothetical protein